MGVVRSGIWMQGQQFHKDRGSSSLQAIIGVQLQFHKDRGYQCVAAPYRPSLEYSCNIRLLLFNSRKIASDSMYERKLTKPVEQIHSSSESE